MFEVPEDEIIGLEESVIINLGDNDRTETVENNVIELIAENSILEEAEEPEEIREPGPTNMNDRKIREFVSHCYATVLGREADEAGLNGYTHQIVTGAKTPKQIAHDFVFSAEFQDKQLSNEDTIRVLYRLYLYRQADEEGLAAWVAQLDAGVSLDEVVNGFAESAEFTAIINGLK